MTKKVDETTIAFDKYIAHIRHAFGRGIEMRLTFTEWFKIWKDSGHYQERGNRKGSYCMSRIGDKGHYEVGNVFIQTNAQNKRDAFLGKTRSPEIGAKIKANLTGRKLTEEHKTNIGLAGIGREPPNKAKYFCVICHKQCAPSYIMRHGAGKKECV